MREVDLMVWYVRKNKWLWSMGREEGGSSESSSFHVVCLYLVQCACGFTVHVEMIRCACMPKDST